MAVKTDKETFEALVATARQFAPRFRVINKKDSRLHRLIGFFSKVYLRRYWTTIGSTVAHPSGLTEEAVWRSWEVIPHEGRHGIQARRVTEPVFLFVYLLGHLTWFIVGGLALLAISVPLWVKVNWWAGLIPLVAFLPASPVPFAWFRFRWEFEAYCLSLAVTYWTTGRIPDAELGRTADQFVTWLYWFMYPWGRFRMMKKLRAVRVKIISGDFAEDEYHAAVLRTLKNCGRYKENGQ